MQITFSLSKDNKQQAEQLRRSWYPHANDCEVRDAFIFSECIDRYSGPFCELEDYMKEATTCDGTQKRTLTIRQESNKRLNDLAFVMKKPVAVTLRAIIAYSVDHVAHDKEKDAACVPDTSEGIGRQRVLETVTRLETQVAACNETILELKTLLEKEENERSLYEEQDEMTARDWDMIEEMTSNMTEDEREDYLEGDE